MDMKIDVTQIIIALITVLLVPFVKVYVAPLFKSKISNDQWKLINQWIVISVKAAETLPEFKNMEKCGKEKFNYVLESIKTTCTKYGITYDETAIRNAIQSVWDDLYNDVTK